MTTVAIMQPTFLPWLGYFALIERADHFVFLDDVQYSKQSWQSRNRIAGPRGVQTLSLSIARKPSKPLISEVRLADTGFERKLLDNLQAAYKPAPYGQISFELVARAFATAGRDLARLNIEMIRNFCELTQIKAEFHLSSDIGCAGAGRSARLAAISRFLGCTEYLSPVGSLHYLKEDKAFENSSTNLRFLNFVHPIYDQGGREFISHLAAIDALAHLGPQNVLPLLRSGLRPPMTMSELERELG